MAVKSDSIYWTYFNEENKLLQNNNFKNPNMSMKEKIDEIFEITYFGLFNYQNLKSKTLNDIELSEISEISKYITENYLLFFKYINSETKKKSLYKEELSTQDKEEIFYIISNIALPYIKNNSFINSNVLNNNNYSLSLVLIELAKKYKFIYNLIDSNEKIVYFGAAYPLFVTMIIIDITNESEMFNNIKSFYTKERISKTFNKGRPLSPEEYNYYKSDIENLKFDEEFNAFLINFKQSNWTTFSLDKKYKLLFQLSKFTALFLKEKIKSLCSLDDGKDLFYSLYNYMYLFLKKDSDNVSDEQTSNQTFIETLEEDEPDQFLSPVNFKDYNPFKIGEHISKLKDYSKFVCDTDRIVDFLSQALYAINYLKMIEMLKKDSYEIGEFLIERKKISLVKTLNLYQKNQDELYEKTDLLNSIDNIDLNSKVFKEMTKKDYSLNDLSNKKSQLVTMLKIISLMLVLAPKTAKRFNYSWEMLLKYYIITFGPYKKQVAVYNKKDIDSIRIQVSKLLNAYNRNKNNENFIDTLFILNKLENFKN